MNIMIRLSFFLAVLISFCVVNGAKFNPDPRLQFITEPVSSLAAADGRRVTFKCVVSASEATIKWLLNGTIINNDSYEWIKLNGNKLVIKLQKKTIHENGNDRTQNNESLNLQGAVFQCLAELNNQVIVSQPAKLIIAELFPFDHQEDVTTSTIAGNTAVISCQLPRSIPFAVTEFEYNNMTISYNHDRYRLLPSGSLQILNARHSDSGNYRCIAHNPFLQEKMFANHFVNLKVLKPRHHSGQSLRNLHFVVKPRENINAVIGSNITLECVANGFPVPKISWSKMNGELPRARSFVDGDNLIITTLQKDDEGTYTCTASNGEFNINFNSIVEVNEIPQIVGNEIYETIDIYEGQDYDVSCNAKGQPKPIISWLHNGYFIDSSTVMDDLSFHEDGAILKISHAKRQLHSGIFQCFATNELGSTYAIKVINVKSTSDISFSNSNETDTVYKFNQKQTHGDSNFKDNFGNNLDSTNSDDAGNHNQQHHNHHHKKKNKNKNLKMIPPSRPEVSKVNDDSVMVRWNVAKNGGLPIMFFKVQFKEIGKGKGDWNTVDEDILPHIFSYAVNGLNANATYRFRIAAVYSNDDNKNGPSSSKFVFQKDSSIKKPSNPPTILNANSISSTEIMLIWDFLNIEMIPIDGFFIYYRAADSAGEYLKVTSLGLNKRQHNVTHLLAGTTYEFKMRCFNVAGTSEFSNIYTIKTLPGKENKPGKKDYDNNDNEMGNSVEDSNNGLISTSLNLDNNKMQLIAIIIVSIALVLVFVACCVICIIRQKNHAPTSKVIKKSNPSTVTTDYYFNSTNIYDRRSNGQLASAITPNSLSIVPTTANTETDSEPNHVNVRVNPLNDVSSLSRKNSLRNSLSYSTHHLFNSANGKPYDPSINHNNIDTSAIASTATIDRKRMIKSVVDPYLDYPRLNHNSASFTRLNGTLERKRRSRTDLNTLDKSYLRNISTNDLDRQSSYLPPNGPIVIMQSSC